jgi:hypothetical protein
VFFYGILIAFFFTVFIHCEDYLFSTFSILVLPFLFLAEFGRNSPKFVAVRSTLIQKLEARNHKRSRSPSRSLAGSALRADATEGGDLGQLLGGGKGGVGKGRARVGRGGSERSQMHGRLLRLAGVEGGRGRRGER